VTTAHASKPRGFAAGIAAAVAEPPTKSPLFRPRRGRVVPV
jgi:hypothetical protein